VRFAKIIGMAALAAGLVFSGTAVANAAEQGDGVVALAQPPAGMKRAVPVAPGEVRPFAGSFTWTADWSVRLTSRTWYQNSGNTTIYSYMNCSGDPYISGYVIKLSGRESVWYGCNGTYYYTWGGVSSGNKNFVLTKSNDGRYIQGNGTTYYP